MQECNAAMWKGANMGEMGEWERADRWGWEKGACGRCGVGIDACGGRDGDERRRLKRWKTGTRNRAQSRHGKNDSSPEVLCAFAPNACSRFPLSSFTRSFSSNPRSPLFSSYFILHFSILSVSTPSPTIILSTARSDDRAARVSAGENRPIRARGKETDNGE